MIEFTISFRYDNSEHSAKVVKSVSASRTDYVVRPVDPSIVQKFGKQMTIFRENNDYNSEHQIDALLVDYFNALVAALREQDTAPGEEAS
ncbi:hypothetical protein [Compostibacter hankyongensis]|uniref:Uncharacterized protein n=1 Tax=Compostibacter hankyongensis TaxID=1007089 RepID=A0ABP8FYM0_9BACT